jgi:hypothetical protein
VSNPALANDHLFIGELLKERLRVELGASVPVEGIEQLSQADDTDKRPIVTYVMWAGDRINTTEQGRAGAGRSSQHITQRWAVVLRVLNVAATGDARNSTAGQWIAQIHRAVHGWTPEGALRRLERAQDAPPSYRPGSALYMLAFEVILIL